MADTAAPGASRAQALLGAARLSPLGPTHIAFSCWIVEAFGGVCPRIRLGLGPSGDEVVVLRRPGASSVRVDAWFPVGGCHPGSVGSVKVGRGGGLGTGS